MGEVYYLSSQYVIGKAFVFCVIQSVNCSNLQSMSNYLGFVPLAITIVLAHKIVHRLAHVVTEFIKYRLKTCFSHCYA